MKVNVYNEGLVLDHVNIASDRRHLLQVSVSTELIWTGIQSYRRHCLSSTIRKRHSIDWQQPNATRPANRTIVYGGIGHE